MLLNGPQPVLTPGIAISDGRSIRL